MSDHWRALAENVVQHIPLVSMVAPQQAKQFEFKDLLAVIVVGAVSAMFGSTMTVQKMEVELRTLKEGQIAVVHMINEDRDLRRREREELLTKVTRIEAERATQERLRK